MFTVPHIPGSHDVKDRVNATFIYGDLGATSLVDYWRRVNGLLLGVYSTYLTQK
jgi:hypothetical protein